MAGVATKSVPACKGLEESHHLLPSLKVLQWPLCGLVFYLGKLTHPIAALPSPPLLLHPIKRLLSPRHYATYAFRFRRLRGSKSDLFSVTSVVHLIRHGFEDRTPTLGGWIYNFIASVQYLAQDLAVKRRT